MSGPITLNRPARFAALGMLVVGIVIAGLVRGPDIIGGMTYSRFRPASVYPSLDRDAEILDRPISATYQRMIKHAFTADGVHYEERDGVLYVRNREWWDKFRMAHIILSTNHPAWPKNAQFRHGVKLLPLYPERSVLAETALFRERRTRYGLRGLDCVFRYYGLNSVSGPDHVLVPEEILHNAAFLRFAVAKASNHRWLADTRSREHGCATGYQELAFASDGTAAPGQPWPHYSADELIRILKQYGFLRYFYRSFPDSPPRVSQGLYSEPEVLDLIAAPAVGGEQSWPQDVAEGPFTGFAPFVPDHTVLAKTALFREHPSYRPLAAVLCVFRYYGVLVADDGHHMKVPQRVVRNNGFLRFAAAKADDTDWLKGVRTRHRLCWSGLETVTFAADGAPADSPWPDHTREELLHAFAHAGIAHRRLADGALRVPAGLYREPEVLRLLVSGSRAAHNAESASSPGGGVD